MATLSFSQLEGAWIAGGGDPGSAPLMAAIAIAESSGDPTATNPTDNNGRQTSWGLWQISNGDHSEPSPNWADPVENARLAVGKIKSQGLGAWGTYTSGAYKRYLQGGVDPSTPGGGAGAGGAAGTGQPAIAVGGLSTDWIIPLLKRLGAGGSSDPVAGMIGSVFGPIANTVTNMGKALETAMHGLLWIVNPMNWVRIIAGIIGTAAVITGAVLVAKSA